MNKAPEGYLFRTTQGAPLSIGEITAPQGKTARDSKPKKTWTWAEIRRVLEAYHAERAQRRGAFRERISGGDL